MGRPAKPTIYKRKDSPYWVLSYHGHDGRRVRRTSGATTKRAATLELEGVLEEEAKKQVLNLPINNGFALFLETRPLKDSSRTRYLVSAKNWKAFFKERGIVDFKQITKVVISDFVKVRRAMVVPKRGDRKVADPTIRRDMAFLSAVWNFLLDEPEWEADMPPLPITRGMRKNVKESRRRIRFAHPDEWAAIMKATTTDQQRRILTVAVETGMREAELAQLPRTCVNLEKREITLIPDLVELKDDDARVIPISQKCFEALSVTPRSDQVPNVFWHVTKDLDGRETHHPFKRFSNFWRGIKRRSNVTNFKFHDIRHTFACNFLRHTRDLAALQRVMGHENIETTMKYAFVLTETLHARVREMDGVQVPQKQENHSHPGEK